jgi:ureidoacrylate peracid hydrolase
MPHLTYEKEITGLVVIDPYNDFISEGGKIWDRIKNVAEGNQCVPHMRQILEAARNTGIRVFYAMHRRYRHGDYETWKYTAPIQKAAWSRKSFEYGTWGGQIRTGFEPRAGDVVAAERGARCAMIKLRDGSRLHPLFALPHPYWWCISP